MSIGNFLSIIKLIIDMLPILIAAIKTVEEAIPGQGAGETKLAAVRGMLEAAYTAAGNTSEQFESIWPALKRTIDALVAAFNATGWNR